MSVFTVALLSDNLTSNSVLSKHRNTKIHLNSGNSDRLYFGGSKITANGDCSHVIKGHLLLGRKVMTNLDSILKSRHYFINKDLSSQGYGFSCGMDVRVGL